MQILGVDPGLHGALALLDNNGGVKLWDVPTVEVVRGNKKKNEVDLYLLNHMVHDLSALLSERIAYVERVSAMPGQGVTSVFTFGAVYGALLQALACNGYTLNHVAPNQWRKKLRVRPGKDGSRLRASELFPQHIGQWNLKKHHNRVEAVLIAHYGLMLEGALRPRKLRLRLAKAGGR